MTSTVLVTGANGFVGRGVVPALRAAGLSVVAAGRRPAAAGEVACDLTADPPVAATALAGIDAVVHLAGLAHVGTGHEAEARAVNTEGTRRLARAAADAGVGRFVFVSTAQVHGAVDPGRAMTPDDPIQPADAYAATKAAAEDALWAVACETGLSAVAVRPPLIYGPGAGANVARLAAWARAGRPLPSACRVNLRSFVARENLADLLALLATRTDAGGQALFVRDGDDRSTGAFYAALCAVYGTRPRYLPLPPALTRALLAGLGRGRMAQSLIGNFRLDDRATREVLGWQPPVALETALARMVADDPA